MKPSKICFSDKFSKLPKEDYAVRIIAMMNNYEFKIVRFKGEFIWHEHTDTDETFIIIKGKMDLHFRDGVVELFPGEMIVIPKGVEHMPVSEGGYEALLIEPKGVSNTGNVDADVTIEKIEWV